MAHSMQKEKRDVSNTTAWGFTLPLLLLLVAGLLGIFHETAWSMVSIWYRSETFAHGFIIVPITLWLVWEKRRQLQALSPQPEYRVLVLLAGAGFVWLAGYLVNAQVVQQLALVSILILALWSVLGNRITWLLAFPLGFLFFAVPMGEDLVPPLMELTATVTVYLIKLSGIPVYREGLFFSLPSGDWSVVEACSGVRYLIASVTLGTLYAYLTYTSLKKRLLFILAATIVPIIANSLRAYMIVMLGHISDMQIATGVDHLIYGWLFFGIVMLIMFSIGAIWRDSEPSTPATSRERASEAGRGRGSQIASLVAVIMCSGIWPLLAVSMESRAPEIMADETLILPQRIGDWNSGPAEGIDWRPEFQNATQVSHRLYQNGNDRILLSVGQYSSRTRDSELINSQNLLLKESEKAWRITGREKTVLNLEGEPVGVDRFLLKGRSGAYQVYSWYRIGYHYTASRYKGKLLEAFYRLTFGRQDSARIVITIPLDLDTREPQPPQQAFLNALLPSVEGSLDKLVSR